MDDHRSTIADAMESAIKYERSRAAIVRALACWETWILLATVGYIACR